MTPPITNELIRSAYTHFTGIANHSPGGKVGIPLSAFRTVFLQVIDQDNWEHIKKYYPESREGFWYVHAAVRYMTAVFNSAETRWNRMMFREEKLTWKSLRYFVEECAVRPWESWLVLLHLEKLAAEE